MRSRGFWLPVLTAAFLASSAGRNASAHDIFVETVDWMPTSRVVSVSVPTTYVATTSYAIPTSFVAPTVYATSYVTERVVSRPASVLVPTSTYYETRYRPSLFGHRLIPTGRTYYTTGYLPTTLYYPTTRYVPTVSTFPTSFVSVPSIVDRSVVASAFVRELSSCCPDAIAMGPATVTTRAVAPERAPRSSAEPAPSRRPTVESEPNIDNEPALESGVEPLPAPAVTPRPRAQTPPAQTAAPATPREAPESVQSPPAPQAPQERRQSTVRPDGEIPAPLAPVEEMEPTPIPAPRAPDVDEDLVPLAPAGTEDLLPAPTEMGSLGNSTRREAQRPVFTPSRAPEPEVRNILFGRVRERETREPEEGVRVFLTNRNDTFEERVAMTDAFGRFAVRLPDGDWDVKVAMPSGRVYTVSQITVSRGEITDDQGRDIPSLTITR